jgi:acyl-CoA carboxylase epsilon subunit-like protein
VSEQPRGGTQLRFTSGDPTPEEVAAVTAVLLALGGSPAAQAEQPPPAAAWTAPPAVQAGAWSAAALPAWTGSPAFGTAA